MAQAPGADVLREQLDRWTSAGLINADQAGLIEAAERARATAVPRRQLPMIAEVLGYVGAVLASAAVAVALREFWKHVPPAAWLAFAGSLAVGFLTAGALVRVGGEPAFARLRSVLWLLGTASVAGFVYLLADKYLHLSENDVTLVAEGVWIACTVPLWCRTRSAVQHVAAFGGAVALVESGIDRFHPSAGTFGYGLALLVLATAWGVAVSRGYLAPRTTGILLSASGALIGAIFTMDAAIGQVLALATVAALLSLGVITRRVLLIGIGAAGILYVIPDFAERYLPGPVATPLAVAAVGITLFVIAVWLARQRRRAG